MSGPEELNPKAPPGLLRAALVLMAPPALGHSLEVREVLEASPTPVSLLCGPAVVSLSTISAGTLAAAVLASHKADPTAGGRLTHPHRPHRPAAATAPPSCSPAIHQMPEASMFRLSPCGSVPSSPASRHSEDGSSLARNCCPAGAGGCGGYTRHPSYAEVVSLPPSS
jgi:hypothetical protein